MQMVRSASVLILIFWACVLTAGAQTPAPSAAQPAVPPQPALTSATAPATAPSSVPSTAPAAVPTQGPDSPPPSAVTLNDVLDRVVQHEHLFMAQMRHMHPLVET
jgi:hypothetical protein